jgi:hypothetical protein
VRINEIPPCVLHLGTRKRPSEYSSLSPMSSLSTGTVAVGAGQAGSVPTVVLTVQMFALGPKCQGQFLDFTRHVVHRLESWAALVPDHDVDRPTDKVREPAIADLVACRGFPIYARG